MWVHWHAGRRAQELSGEVAFLIQHQLLRAVPYGVCGGEAVPISHRGLLGSRRLQLGEGRKANVGLKEEMAWEDPSGLGRQFL